MIDMMNEESIRAMLQAVPIETTVIDAKDEVIGWNKHPRRRARREEAQDTHRVLGSVRHTRALPWTLIPYLRTLMCPSPDLPAGEN
jgi:hypothetical protein